MYRIWLQKVQEECSVTETSFCVIWQFWKYAVLTKKSVISSVSVYTGRHQTLSQKTCKLQVQSNKEQQQEWKDMSCNNLILLDYCENLKFLISSQNMQAGHMLCDVPNKISKTSLAWVLWNLHQIFSCYINSISEPQKGNFYFSFCCGNNRSLLIFRNWIIQFLFIL